MLALAVLTSIAACVEETGPVDGPLGVRMTDAERADCVARGGKVATGGMLGSEQCFRPTPDAGKACKKASDCSGACLGETMTCSAVTPMFGCFEVVMEDGQKAGLCVD